MPNAIGRGNADRTEIIFVTRTVCRHLTPKILYGVDATRPPDGPGIKSLFPAEPIVLEGTTIAVITTSTSSCHQAEWYTPKGSHGQNIKVQTVTTPRLGLLISKQDLSTGTDFQSSSLTRTLDAFPTPPNFPPLALQTPLTSTTISTTQTTSTTTHPWPCVASNQRCPDEKITLSFHPVSGP